MDAQLITTIATAITILASVIGATLYLERRFGRLEQRIDRLEQRIERLATRIEGVAVGIRSVNQQLSSLFTLLSGVFAALHKAGSLPDEDYRRTATGLVEMLSRATEPLVESITASTNPLSVSEAQRFRELVAKARRSEFFTEGEAEEYNVLLKKVQIDRGDDPAIWPLVALGAFLLGMYLGSRGRNNDPPRTMM